MAVELYRPGTTHIRNGITCEAEIFNEYSFTSLLDAGWFLTPEEINETEEEKLRAMAKEKGIRNWHNMKIENLREKLNDTEG